MFESEGKKQLKSHYAKLGKIGLKGKLDTSTVLGELKLSV
jgi:hypothetical protein